MDTNWFLNILVYIEIIGYARFTEPNLLQVLKASEEDKFLITPFLYNFSAIRTLPGALS